MHNCGPLALQESPTVAGDEVRIGNDRMLAAIRLILWHRRPVSHVVETISSSWTAICWRSRTAPKLPPSQTLPSSWTGIYIEDGRREHTARFRYPGLLTAPDAVRLVNIHSPTNDGIINATLSDAILSQNPYFYALSYEWGPIEGLRTILLNGFSIQIRKNLYDFLSIYSEKGGARALWIDAICINQDDVQERNRQVSLMGDIYKTATCVRLWLGNEADSSGALLRHFREEGACIRAFARLPSNDDRDVRVVTELPPALEPTPPDLSQHVTALARLLRRSYWERAWIVQELILGRDITVHCGRETVSWSYLVALASSVWREYFEGTVIDKLFEHKLILTQGRMSLLEILSLYPNRKCQEPRDQVYSLLSLDSTPLKSGKKIIEVDYDIDLCSLLLRTFNASQGLTTRDAANFERLRLTLGLEWDDLFDAVHKPRYVRHGEPWFNPDRPFDVFAQDGSWGRVVTADPLSTGSYAGMLFITSDDDEYAWAPFHECGLARHATVGDYIFGLFGTSLALLFRLVEERLVFVAPMIIVTMERVAKPEDVKVSDFEHRLLLSSLFCRDDPTTGWNNFVRLNFLQWAATCGCLGKEQKLRGRLPPTAGRLPGTFWEMVDTKQSTQCSAGHTH